MKQSGDLLKSGSSDTVITVFISSPGIVVAVVFQRVSDADLYSSHALRVAVGSVGDGCIVSVVIFQQVQPPPRVELVQCDGAV